MSNTHIFGQLLLIEVPIVSAGVGYLFKRLFDRADKRTAAIEATLDSHTAALEEQSRALAVTVAAAPNIEKRLGVVEERITGIRETTAALRASVDMVLLAAPPPRVQSARPQAL